MNATEKWLEQYFDEVTPREFYREIFPKGELEQKGVYEDGKYNAIAVCISQKKKKQKINRIKHHDGSITHKEIFNEDGSKKMEPFIYRYSVTDDLDVIDDLVQRDDVFCLMSPLSYAGKNRTAQNARIAYGMAFDVDHLRIRENGHPIGIENLWVRHIENVGRIPKPTYIVFSGTGVHLYYLFEEPIPLFKNIVKQLQTLKHELTDLMWHDTITGIKSADQVQYEGIFQGFRIPGTITKNGSRARVFLTGDRVSIEYLNSFVEPEYQVTEYTYKSKLTLKKAKELYPEWYEKRIVNGQKTLIHPWAISRRLYDWWKRELLARKVKVGHRYYCMMILAVYARKCGIFDAKKNPNPVTREELERDAYELMDVFEGLTDRDDNHFDEGDVLDALEAYDDHMLTYPWKSVRSRSGIEIPKNKRNGRRQEVHIKTVNAMRRFRRDELGEDEYKNNGRPIGSGTAQQRVQQWRSEHSDGSKSQCKLDTGLSYPTIRKWWDNTATEL